MTSTGDRWYFAYGSNLSVDQKELRTGRIRIAQAEFDRHHPDVVVGLKSGRGRRQLAMITGSLMGSRSM